MAVAEVSGQDEIALPSLASKDVTDQRNKEIVLKKDQVLKAFS